MYEVSVRRTFVAQHYLTVPDPGPEGVPHSHTFTAEVALRGPELGEYGYLVDIDDVKAGVDAVVDHYRDELLNDHAAFEGANPSVERFARVFARSFLDVAEPSTPEHVRVRLWEDEEAWASYETAVDEAAPPVEPVGRTEPGDATGADGDRDGNRDDDARTDD
jgi:6-pyruvoyltetrahydropterin/6-carboxytetrahydropterin synthase